LADISQSNPAGRDNGAVFIDFCRNPASVFKNGYDIQLILIIKHFMQIKPFDIWFHQSNSPEKIWHSYCSVGEQEVKHHG